MPAALGIHVEAAPKYELRYSLRHNVRGSTAAMEALLADSMAETENMVAWATGEPMEVME